MEQAPSQRAQEMREMVQNNPAAMAFKERFAAAGSMAEKIGAVGCLGCNGSRGCCVSVEAPKEAGVADSYKLEKISTTYTPDSPVPKPEAIAAYNAMRKKPEEDEYEDEIDPKTGKKTGKKKKKKDKRLVKI